MKLIRANLAVGSEPRSDSGVASYKRLGRLLGRLPGDGMLWLTLGLTAFAWVALLSPGYFFKAHDARHSVYFLVEFDAAIRDGAWWPRWTMDQALGYGYPLWIFYSPLSYYVAEAFHLLGLGFAAAVKATYLTGFLAAAWAMYALVRRWWGRPAGLVAALAYTYAPYHLVDIYVRSALAEFMALLWFPLAMLAFDELVTHGGRRRLAWAALAFAGLTLTHSVTALAFTPVLAAFVLWELLRLHAPRETGRHGERETRRLSPPLSLSPRLLCTPAPLHRSGGWGRLLIRAVQALAAALLGIGMSAIFLVPMILERPFIAQEQWVRGTYQFQQHFVYLHQFFSPLWDFLYSVEGPKDGMSFQLGAVIMVLALGVIVAALLQPGRERARILFMAAATLALVFGMTGLSEPLWRSLPLVQLIQFPWRLLAPTAVILAILAGATIAVLPDTDSYASAGMVGLLLILASLPYTVPQFTPVTPEDESALAVIRFETDYPDMVGMTAWASALPTDSPLVAQYREGKPLQKLTILRGQGQVETTRVGGASVEGRVRAAEPVTVQFLTYWFPGWQARVDGQPVDSRPEGTYGLLTLDIPAGEHTVSIRMGSTPARNAGAALSAVSLLITAAVALIPWRRGS